jgi:hypothetical protein
MSNLKYLNRIQLLGARQECSALIAELDAKIRKMENGPPAWISFSDLEYWNNRIRGQTERLKWINWYLERNPEKIIQDFCSMRGIEKDARN